MSFITFNILNLVHHSSCNTTSLTSRLKFPRENKIPLLIVITVSATPTSIFTWHLQISHTQNCTKPCTTVHFPFLCEGKNGLLLTHLPVWLGTVAICLPKIGRWCKIFIDCHCCCVLVDKVHFFVPLGFNNVQNTLV